MPNSLRGNAHLYIYSDRVQLRIGGPFVNQFTTVFQGTTGEESQLNGPQINGISCTKVTWGKKNPGYGGWRHPSPPNLHYGKFAFS